MADQTESESSQKSTKKRTRNPSEWKREKRKRLRIAGKEYINTRGELISGRKIGEDCRCRRQCYKNVSEEVRKKLFEGYYSLNSHDEQNAYLFGLIRKKDIARKRSKDSVRRTCTYTYYVRNRGKEIQVCRLAFAHIHGISSPKIRNLCLKLDMNVMFPRDGRGKHDHRPKKITDETMEQIRQHIYSIIRTDRVKDFMKDEKNNGPDVNITKMWKDYLRKFEPLIDIEAISSKPQKAPVPGRTETFEGMNGGPSPHLHPSHPAMMGHLPPTMLQYGMHATGDHFINLGEVERRASGLGLYPHMTSEESMCSSTVDPTGVSTLDNQMDTTVDSLTQSDGGANSDHQDENHNDEEDSDEEKKKLKTKPMVKHWLYSKVFHEELKFHDFLSLRKKLWDLKGEKMLGPPGAPIPQSKSVPKNINSNNNTNNMVPKSERKQKMPKKITRTKDEEKSLMDRPQTPEMNMANHSSFISFGSSLLGNACSSAPGIQALVPAVGDMYLLPVQLQDISQMQPQRLQQPPMSAMDLVTSQQPHLAHHHPHNQTHAGMQLNLHSFASASSAQHQNGASLQSVNPMVHQQNGGQLHCLPTNSMQTMNLSQNPCNYMNINAASFYQ